VCQEARRDWDGGLPLFGSLLALREPIENPIVEINE
jgi:hypothetical protein